MYHGLRPCDESSGRGTLDFDLIIVQIIQTPRRREDNQLKSVIKRAQTSRAVAKFNETIPDTSVYRSLVDVARQSNRDSV